MYSHSKAQVTYAYPKPDKRHQYSAGYNIYARCPEDLDKLQPYMFWLVFDLSGKSTYAK